MLNWLKRFLWQRKPYCVRVIGTDGWRRTFYSREAAHHEAFRRYGPGFLAKCRFEKIPLRVEKKRAAR